MHYAKRHADRRTTLRYDMAKANLDPPRRSRRGRMPRRHEQWLTHEASAGNRNPTASYFDLKNALG